MHKLVFFILLSLFFISTNSIKAQTPVSSPTTPALSGIKATLAAGEVSNVSQSDNKILLKTTDGDIEVVLAETTTFKKVSPEKPDLKTATDTDLDEIGVADKILVTGKVSDDKKTIAAKVVYLMTKSDISKKIAAEREAWRIRGISGRVESVDFRTKTITVVTRSMAGETKIALTPKDLVSYKRYAPDSVKFADAKDSNLAEIKVGDQLRALGDKSEDGLSFKAEQIVTGAFKTVVGKVTAIDVAQNQITIEDAQTKKPVTIIVNSSSLLKRFPPEMAQAMAAMRMGSGQGGANLQVRPPQGGQTPPQNNQATPPSGQNTPNGQGGGQRFMMRGGQGGLDDMFNNFPTLPLAELKVGDTIGVTSTAGAIDNRYVAIKLLSGVEPFLAIPQMQNVGGRGGQSPNFDIPGLDGGFGN